MTHISTNTQHAQTHTNNDTGNVDIFLDDDNIDITAHIDDDARCAHCGEGLVEDDDAWVHDHDISTDCDATPTKRAPGNWVGFTLDAERESTQVQISLGDPRGCLTMTVRKGVDPRTGEECMMLDVPHADDALPHVEIKHVYDGTFVIK